MRGFLLYLSTMNFVPIIRASRKVWRLLTYPIGFVLSIALWCLALLPAIFVFIVAYFQGRRVSLRS